LKQLSELTISKTQTRILSIIRIASKTGQAISFNEISMLLADSLESSDIKKIIEKDKKLLEKLSVENKHVVLKGYEKLFLERKSRDKNSKNMLKNAKLFVNQIILSHSYLKMIGVCGSVAYNSAAKYDDIDFFIVSKRNRLWLSILRVYIIARAFSFKSFILRKKFSICLSYIISEDRLEQKMLTMRTPLFAREFLSIHVLDGLLYFKEVLEKNVWLKDFFPRLVKYKLLNIQHSKIERQSKVNDSNPFLTILNLGIFKVLQGYLLLKAFMLNLRFKRHYRFKDLFEATITPNLLVYTSKKYREIEKIYETFENY